jgi:hypothetical protein
MSYCFLFLFSSFQTGYLLSISSSIAAVFMVATSDIILGLDGGGDNNDGVGGTSLNGKNNTFL